MNKNLKQIAQFTIINALIFSFTVFITPKKIVTNSKNNVATQSSQKILSPTVTTTTVDAGTTNDNTSGNLTQTPTQIPAQKISVFDQVLSHGSQSDCWMIIEGHVYDISSYFGSHPGGDQRLLDYCGKDATSAFQSKPGSGADHSVAARSMLQSYLIE